MKNVSWYCRTYSGYGDMITPLCYSQNLGEIFDTKVTLIMKWAFKEERNPEDDLPDERMNYILDNFVFPNVVVKYEYNHCYSSHNTNEKLRHPISINNLHNVYFPQLSRNIIPTYNVVCSPINNNESFTTFSEGYRTWKDVFTTEQWQKIINKPNTIHIDYRTPVQEAIDILYKCKFFIGYHGSCAWLARLMGIPMKVYSCAPNLTNYTFPWNSHKEYTLEQSILKVDNCRVMRDKFIIDYRKVMNNDTVDDLHRLRLERAIGL